MENVLQNSSEILTEIAAMAKIGAWEMELPSRQLSWSTEAFSIHGAYGKANSDILEIIKGYEENSMERVRKLLTNAMEKGEPWDDELVFNHPVKGSIWIRSIGKAIMEGSEVKKLFGVFLDVTERKDTEINLLRAKELAEEADRLKTGFLSTMSHEIRTPLNAIVGFTELLLKETYLDHQLEYLNILKYSASNLMDLVNDILDYHKIQAGKLDFESIGFDLRLLLEQTTSYFVQQLADKQVVLKTELDPAIPKMIKGDRARLAQILNNLIGNAVKFTDKGQVIIKVENGQYANGIQDLIFSIQDTGIGIAAPKLTTIFNSFTQASKDTTRKYGGSGLGLSITKLLIELQGGNISVKSEPEVGSVFTFNLGFASSKLNTKADGSVDTSLSGIKVLVVEDNHINVLLLSRLLDNWEVEYQLAANGLQAVEMSKLKVYDLILMDLHMPVMDGYQATATIRSKKGYNQFTPILALTASIITVNLGDMLEKGFSELIFKPYDPILLLKKMKQMTNS